LYSGNKESAGTGHPTMVVVTMRMARLFCLNQKKTIQSLRLRLHSGLRQQGRVFGLPVIGMAEAMPFRSVPQQTVGTVQPDSTSSLMIRP
jgi:hypothetical protein